MVSNLVSNAGYPPACAIPPPRGIVYEPDLRLGITNRQLDGFIMAGGSGLLSIHDGDGCLFITPLLRKEEKDVGSVGCVAQSEKSTENSQ